MIAILIWSEGRPSQFLLLVLLSWKMGWHAAVCQFGPRLWNVGQANGLKTFHHEYDLRQICYKILLNIGVIKLTLRWTNCGCFLPKQVYIEEIKLQCYSLQQFQIFLSLESKFIHLVVTYSVIYDRYVFWDSSALPCIAYTNARASSPWCSGNFFSLFSSSCHQSLSRPF